MNEQELQKLLALTPLQKQFFDLSSIPEPEKDRTLLAAGIYRESFHVYMTDGRIHACHWEHGKVRALRIGRVTFQELTPPIGLKVFSYSTEWWFAKKLIDFGADLDFNPINIAAGANHYRFYQPYHLAVATRESYL